MKLGPVSLLDCLVFVVFLAPQLILQAGLFRSVLVALRALPYLLLWLPIDLVKERLLTREALQPAFVRTSTLFEDLVIRCVRYAFSHIPASVGRVFFSKPVALPFLRWRLLRHGYLQCPVTWREYAAGEGKDSFRGVWITHRRDEDPDFVLYYLHGGGFSMGSSFFYLEFLLVWHHLLVEAGYRNPAIFSLEYSLVPDEIYPKQLLEAVAGYQHVLDVAKDASKVCVGGDSAGGTLILSLLQELGAQGLNQDRKGAHPGVRGGLIDPEIPTLASPRMATLISPWVTLMTKLHKPSPIDYLNRQMLWRYAHEYAGEAMIHQHPGSPGSCDDDELWKASCPDRGYFVIYGEEEVFAPDIEAFVRHQAKLGNEVDSHMIHGGVHAWPVASLFLASREDSRLHGLRAIIQEIRKRFDDASG